MHVTLRVSRAVGNLRSKRRFQPIKRALRDGAERFECRLVHFSVQKNHLHLLVEPRDRRSLMRAMKGLQVRLARRLNTALKRRGQVFSDRYHAHVLRTPREARHAIAYVLLNARKHAAQGGHTLPKRWIDPYSSARWFDGFENGGTRSTDDIRIGGPPGVWLLRRGWRDAGPIYVDEVPGRRARVRL
ncbi:MAG: transposase [Deltaproteobacteria bacterium]